MALLLGLVLPGCVAGPACPAPWRALAWAQPGLGPAIWPPLAAAGNGTAPPAGDATLPDLPAPGPYGPIHGWGTLASATWRPMAARHANLSIDIAFNAVGPVVHLGYDGLVPRPLLRSLAASFLDNVTPGRDPALPLADLMDQVAAQEALRAEAASFAEEAGRGPAVRVAVPLEGPFALAALRHRLQQDPRQVSYAPNVATEALGDQWSLQWGTRDATRSGTWEGHTVAATFDPWGRVQAKVSGPPAEAPPSDGVAASAVGSAFLQWGLPAPTPEGAVTLVGCLDASSARFSPQGDS